MNVPTYVGIIFGYLTSILWCLRWLPTLFYHIKHKKYMKIHISFIIIESFASLSGILYGYFDNLLPVIITNSLGLFTTIAVIINNKYNAINEEL